MKSSFDDNKTEWSLQAARPDLLNSPRPSHQLLNPSRYAEMLLLVKTIVLENFGAKQLVGSTACITHPGRYKEVGET